jgi:hypothetical protein
MFSKAGHVVAGLRGRNSSIDDLNFSFREVLSPPLPIQVRPSVGFFDSMSGSHGAPKDSNLDLPALSSFPDDTFQAGVGAFESQSTGEIGLPVNIYTN